MAVPRSVAQKIIFSSLLSWSLSLARLRIWSGIVTRTRSIGMLNPTHTTPISISLVEKKHSVELTPSEHIIINTFGGVDVPNKITVEWYTSDPPGYTHGNHKTDDEGAEAIDKISETCEMPWHCFCISQDQSYLPCNTYGYARNNSRQTSLYSSLQYNIQPTQT